MFPRNETNIPFTSASILTNWIETTPSSASQFILTSWCFLSEFLIIHDFTQLIFLFNSPNNETTFTLQRSCQIEVAFFSFPKFIFCLSKIKISHCPNSSTYYSNICFQIIFLHSWIFLTDHALVIYLLPNIIQFRNRTQQVYWFELTQRSRAYTTHTDLEMTVFLETGPKTSMY